jgi:hypothetical protein
LSGVGARNATAALMLLALVAHSGCREKVSAAQCEALVDRYAELVVLDKMPDAPQELVRQEQKLVRDQASADEGFRNCTTEVGPKEFACAMAAKTPDAIEKCLE